MTARRGLDVSEAFFREVVGPIVASVAPGLRYAAALIGPGSEVLGYDDDISRDHDWAPRALLFVPPDADREAIRLALDGGMPDTFGGYPVRIQPADPGAGVGGAHRSAGHRVEVTSVASWFGAHLGWADLTYPTVEDWLAVPQQRLLEATAGRVFRDDPGELTAARERLGWYPADVWRYLLASAWQRVAQLEPFVGRTGDVGDDVGSRLVAASQVRDAIRIAFLLERQYAPYAKWFGTAFSRLDLAGAIGPDLGAAMVAGDWSAREATLLHAMVRLADATNALELAEPVEASPRSFYGRPYRVLAAHRLRDALAASITDGDVRRVIRARGWTGSVDQWSDNVDVLERRGVRPGG